MQDLTHLDGNHPTSNRHDGAALWRDMAEERMTRISDVIAGKANEIDEDDLMLAVEIDAPSMHWDHTRLLRAASLAIQYHRVNPRGHPEPKFIKRVAAVFQVDPEDLKAYALVLQREMRHRERTGSSPLSDLPRLIRSALELDAADLLAIAPPPTRFKHDPSEYVELAEQGLNNTEIANYLGDVSEAPARPRLRGLQAHIQHERGDRRVRIYLDDVRDAPPGWVRARTPEEVISLLQTGEVEELSLDHDLGLDAADAERSGYSVLAWLEREVGEGRWSFPLPEIAIHSANPPGRERMRRAIEAIGRLHSAGGQTTGRKGKRRGPVRNKKGDAIP